MEINDQTLTELLRLTQENNRMLHKMRRNAFWGGVVKFILYALIFIVAPLWIYSTYLAPIMQGMLQTMDQIRGTGAKAETQFQSFQDAWKQFESKLPPAFQPKQQ